MTTTIATSRVPEPDEPHGVSAPLPHHPINYLAIFYTLVVLTVVTVAVAYYRAPNELINVAIALLIASTKAGFVCRYFMHLKYEGKLIYLILLIPVSLAVIMIIALIPDIGHGRETAFNDMIRMFQQAMVGAPAGDPK